MIECVFAVYTVLAAHYAFIYVSWRLQYVSECNSMYRFTILWRQECCEVVVHGCAYDVCIFGGVFRRLFANNGYEGCIFAYVTQSWRHYARVSNVVSYTCVTRKIRPLERVFLGVT